MNYKVLLVAFLVSGSVWGQQYNDSFYLSPDNGDLSMRRGTGDTKWKRALVPLWDGSLSINHGGDFPNGARIMGSKLLIDGDTRIYKNLGVGVRAGSTLSERLTVSGNIKLGSTGNKIYWDWPGRAIEQYSSGGSNKMLRFTNSMSSGGGNPDGGFSFTDHTGKDVLRIVNYSVGVGIAKPEAKLHVNGNALFEQSIEVQNSIKLRKSDGTGTAGFDLAGNGGFIHVAGDGLLGRNDGEQSLGYGNWRFKDLWLAKDANIGGNTKISGKLGIGTDQIKGAMTVKGGNFHLESGEVGKDFQLIFDPYEGIKLGGDARYFHLNRYRDDNVAIGFNSKANLLVRNGNVGIGVVNPKAKLHVFNGSNSYGSILATADESAFTLYTKTLNTQVNSESFRLGLKYNEDENNGFISFYRGSSSKGGFLGFSTNGEQRMLIDSKGKIGIGKTDPTQPLDVNGNINTNDRYLLKNGQGSISIRDDRTDIYKGSGVSLSYYDNENKTMVAGLALNQNGNIGIGTTDPKNKLSVNGHIWAKEVKVSLTDAADWVFEDDYNLRPLTEVENYIKANKHLPEIPSAEEFRKNDLKVSEMTNKLLQKIEELTLYAIEQQKRIDTQNQTQKALEARLAKLEALLSKTQN